MKTATRIGCMFTGLALAAGGSFAATSSTTTGVHTSVASTCTLYDGDDGGLTHTTRVLDFGDYTTAGVAAAVASASADYNPAGGYSGGSMGGASLPTNAGTAFLGVVVACSIGTEFSVGIDRGTQPSGTQRRMAHSVSGVGDTINYGIGCSAVVDATATSALSGLLGTLTALGVRTSFDITQCASDWGTSGETKDFLGVGVGESVPIPVPVVASIPAGQGNKTSGAYGDIVTVTVEW